MGKSRNKKRNLSERYGVEEGRYYRSGQNYTNAPTPKDYEDRLIAAANSDPNTHDQAKFIARALEDEEFRKSLGKKSQKFLNDYKENNKKGFSGIDSIKDLNLVNDYGKIFHKHELNHGGKFSSANDFFGASLAMEDATRKYYDRNFLTKDDQLLKEPDIQTPKSLLPDNYTPSEETAAAQDFVSKYEKSIRNSPDGLLDPGSMGESQTLKGTSFNAENAAEENDKAQDFFQDQLLNLTEGFKKYNINTVGPNSIASKNRDLLRSFPTT